MTGNAGRSGLGLANLGREPTPPPQRGPCAVPRCGTKRAPVRISETERLCEKHATKAADAAFRGFIRSRDPRCVACGRDAEGVQCAHIVTRGARYVRWDATNAVGLCARCHYAYTKRPAAWLAFVERTWPGRLQRILRRENYGERLGGSVDVADVVRRYRAGEPWEAPDPPEAEE